MPSLFAKDGRRLCNHIEHWTRNSYASNVPSNPLAGELRARGSMGNGRWSTRVGPQGFRVTRSFVPLGRFMTIASCDEFSHPASNMLFRASTLICDCPQEWDPKVSELLDGLFR
jgi:hypothetical protein